MAVFCAMFPILPGKTEQIKELGARLSGELADDFDKSQQHLQVPVESYHVQQTPMGDFLLVYLECPDVGQMFATFAQGQSPSDRALKDTIKECTGVDLDQPLPGMPSFPILDYRAK